MRRKLTTEEFIQRIVKIHGDKYNYSKIQYTGAHNKVTLTCKKHGDFKQIANNVYKSDCLKCYKEKIKSTDEEKAVRREAYNKIYFKVNKNKIAEQRKSYYKKNKENIAEKKKAFYDENKDKISEAKKLYNKNNKDKISENKKAYHQKNKKQIREKRKTYISRPEIKEKMKEYQRKRHLENPEVRIHASVASQIRRALGREGKDGKRTFEILGYTPKDLRNHLENQWEFWMHWGNYGHAHINGCRSWHIDHIRPSSSFKYSSTDDQAFKDCWKLSNLRPLDSIENIIKGNKFIS